MTTRSLVVIPAFILAAMSAASQERPAGFQDLLRKGDVAGLTAVIDTDPAVVNRLDAQGFPPLFWATFYGQRGIVELLLARGADARASTPAGTAVHAVIHGGHPEMVKPLAAAGSDLNDGGVAGNPPLIYAADRGLLPVVEALVDAGASIAATDRMGDTALFMAASFGREPIVRFLVSKGADPNTANSRGDRPLDVARRQGHAGIVAYLESRGATARAPVTNPTGPFLGQTPPGATARLFAPSIVSTERRELNLAFTPDGKTMFFSRDRDTRGTVIMMSTVEDGHWTTPEPAPFSRGGHSDVDMFVTGDGREIYFCSDRPVPGAPASAPAQPTTGGAPPPERAAIWVVTRTAAGWTEPAWLGPIISSGAADYYPTLTSSGTLYFSSNRPGGLGRNDIYRARRVDGKWLPPENLGAPVSSEFREFDPFIAPDESYLIFSSNRPGGLGASDLYVSFRNAGGTWTEPRNLGPAVNTAANEFTPMLSPDGKYLFFTSDRESHDDLFWIDSGVIAALRPEKVAEAAARERATPSDALPYGPHAVGFTLIADADPTRSFPTARPGVPAARPMRVYVWYPARPSTKPAMNLGDFVSAAADDFRRSPGATRTAGRPDVLPVPLAKGLEPAQLEALLADRTRSVRDAAPLPGPFPVVVVAQGLYYESPLSQVHLSEYLASRGYVVATCPLLGTQSRLVNLDVEDLETVTRDLEWVMGTVRRRFRSAGQPLGVAGFDLGGMAGLVLAMRNPEVEAFLSLDAGIQSPHHSGLPVSHPQYREDRFVIPWMHMMQNRFVELLREAPKKDPTFNTLSDRKRSGDTYLVGVPTDSHGVLSSYGMFGIQRAIPGYWEAIPSDPRPVHAEVLRLAGVFFDATLKSVASAKAELVTASGAGRTRGSFPIAMKEGGLRPPSGAEIVDDIIEHGVAHARAAIERARSAAPWRPAADESELTWLGYHFLLWWGREAEAVDVFRLTTELYPASANAFDSLGEAYLKTGRTDEAIAAYRKSLDLNPKNANAVAALERLTAKKQGPR